MQNQFNFFLVCFLLNTSILFSQSVEEIKSQKNIYLFGEGRANSLDKAKSLALDDLISQISITVQSDYLLQVDFNETKTTFNKTEKITSVVRTFSNATLTNTEIITLSDEPNAKVFMYIKKEDVNKIFEIRKQKIFNNIKTASVLEKQFNIADALKLYYWSLLLLKSVPDCNSIMYKDDQLGETNLITWLPLKISEILKQIDYKIIQIDSSNEQLKKIEVQFTYLKKTINSLEFTYWDGRNYSEIIACSDGMAILELPNSSFRLPTIRVKLEYKFQDKARIDKELEKVMEEIGSINFKEAALDIDLKQKNKYAIFKPSTIAYVENVVLQKDRIEKTKDAPTGVSIGEKELMSKKVKNIIQGIKSKQYEQLKPNFTEEGWKNFQQIIQFGKAQMLSSNDLSIEKLDDLTICRSAKMQFSFPNNNRKFVEDVVFSFNAEGKIEIVNFGLNKIALASIEEKNSWKREHQLLLIQTLESYKTAYALKRIDYLKNIFDDKAIIIVGKNVEVVNDTKNPYLKNTIVKTNRISKNAYLKNLEQTFASNEFVNIVFEQSEVNKGGINGNIYGVLIKQNYFSSSYGDQGFLFLMMDISDKKKPIIHIRTWQPLDNKTVPYNIGDF